MRPKSLLRKIKTASRFTPSEWRILLYAYFLILKIRLFLFFSPAQLLQKAGTPIHSESSVRTSTYSKRELLSFFHLAWRYQGKRPKCLATALAKQIFLSHYGFPVVLRIGVRKENRGLGAHAWCEDPLSSKDEIPTLNESFHVMEKVG